MSSQESAEAKALNEATESLAAEVADLSALEPEIASKLAVAQDQLAHVNPVSVEQVNAVAALAHTLGGLTVALKGAVGVPPAAAESSAAAGVPAETHAEAPETPPVVTATVAEPSVAEPAPAEPASESVPPPA